MFRPWKNPESVAENCSESPVGRLLKTGIYPTSHGFRGIKEVDTRSNKTKQLPAYCHNVAYNQLIFLEFCNLYPSTAEEYSLLF